MSFRTLALDGINKTQKLSFNHVIIENSEDEEEIKRITNSKNHKYFDESLTDLPDEFNTKI